MKKIIAILVVLYIGVCGAIYFVPQAFFYNPYSEKASLENAHKYGYKGKEVEYKSADGTDLIAWMTKPGKKKQMVVFMHGNSYSIEEFFYKMIPFVQAGYGTMLPEYRGFGAVKGEINQKNLEADAIASIDYLHKLGYKNKDIIIYGMSLGTHMAVNTVYQLNKQGKFNALILEVPFDSLLNVTKKVIPVPLPLDYIVKDKYDNLAMIDKINTRLLIMGGSRDSTIPISLAENLYEHAVQPKKLIIYEGGKHSNLFNYRNDKDILNWLNKK